MRVVTESLADLEAYGTAPIAFTISSRVDLETLLATGQIVEVPVSPREKDYDSFEDERPVNLARRVDLGEAGIFAAYEDSQRVGGAIVACSVPGYDLADGTAILLDLRVHPAFRGKGAGRALFEAALEWARSHGCPEIVVETQDTNVAACRFYAKMGGELASADPLAYGPDLDEVRLLWRFAL